MAKNFTQAHVADCLGVKRVNVTKWESDEYMPAARRLTALADLLGVSEEWLLSDKGEPPRAGPLTKVQEAEALLRRLPPDELEREIAYLRAKVGL